MVTIRKYFEPGQAWSDKCMLEASGIAVFLADECSSTLGFGSIIGGARLQVEEADVERANQVLNHPENFPPLPDDFVPPPTTSPG